MDPVTIASSNMTDAASPGQPDPTGRSLLLELPSELRSRIYSFLHERPRITIQYGKRNDYDEDFYLEESHTLCISSEGSFPNSSRVKGISFKSPSPGVPDYLLVVHEDYEWQYLLTCRDIHKEAEHILPGMLHLRILVWHFDVQHIPSAVRAHYLPHIRTLTIIGSYPVYNTIFNGSQLTSLKTVYLRNEGPSATIYQQFGTIFPPPSTLIARIQGSDDREYIEKGLRKLQVSKLNWWQAEKSQWLHSVLDVDRPRNFQLIISQDVHIMFIEPVSSPKIRYISLELLFDAANGALVHRKVMMSGALAHREVMMPEEEEQEDARELRNEGEISAYFR